MPDILVTPAKGLFQQTGTSGTLSGHKRVVRAVTADTTLDASDSGKIIQVNPAATTTIQLPSAATVGAGWFVTVVVTEDDGGDMDQNVNIATAASEFYNGIIIGGDGGGSVVANGTSNRHIQILKGSGKSQSGERFDIFSDGTRMHATGYAIDVSDTKFHDDALA